MELVVPSGEVALALTLFVIAGGVGSVALALLYGLLRDLLARRPDGAARASWAGWALPVIAVIAIVAALFALHPGVVSPTPARARLPDRAVATLVPLATPTSRALVRPAARPSPSSSPAGR
jgi:hypothetical protein